MSTVHTLHPSPLGELLLTGARSPAGFTLTSLSLPAGENPSGERDDRPFAEAHRQLDAYFAGRLPRFELPLTATGTPFQRAVWRALEDIPYGTTITYGELTARLGLPRARAQAVGRALGANPHLLVRPCHRVIGADGSMRGYAGGTDAKVRLLTHEGALQPALIREHTTEESKESPLMRFTPAEARRRVAGTDWASLAAELDALGCAATGPLLTPSECADLAALYDEPRLFRTTVDLARHRFGSGEYRYFTHDLPAPVAALRAALYPRLLPLARDWASRLGRPAPWPDTLEEWLDRCHAAGQDRSAQILLRYGPGDWNALHRDVFGDLVFPLQVVIALDVYGGDYTGGEFLMVEQRPRAQSRGTATALRQGHGLVFTTRDRPVRSRRGWSAGAMRHGVSTVRSGRRRTLGLVFHDAK